MCGSSRLLILAVLGLALWQRQAQAVEPNLVVQENRRAGTQSWLLAETSVDENQRSQAIEGYCSETSVAAGQTQTLYVSMNPAATFQLDIYRLGYYGGDGARHIQTIGPLEGKTQPDPQAGENNVYECDWEPTAMWEIPSDWLSGVYLGKLSSLPRGPQSYVIFIVRDDRQADFIFQCADFTWQAYNRWPAWASLYDYQGRHWETEQSNAISFDRPYARYYNGLPAKTEDVTRYVGSGEFLLWEYPLAFWMEQHGYDVTYISNHDTDADAQGLLRAKGFLSVGHDEYWTDRMMENVTAARRAGVHLAFLGGNSLWHAVKLSPSKDDRPRRVFAREHRFENEQELMGASSYGVGLADWTCQQPDHWLFAGTGMSEGDAIAGLVGWEFHGPPLGAQSSLEVLAGGHVHEPDGTPKEEKYAATIYQAPRGNIVFNAGTCWWAVPLSTPPGFFYPNSATFERNDPQVRQITKNLLERMLNGDVNRD